MLWLRTMFVSLPGSKRQREFIGDLQRLDPDALGLYPSTARSKSMDGTSRIAVARGAAGHIGRAFVVHLGDLGDSVDRPPVLREPRGDHRGRLDGPVGPDPVVVDPQGQLVQIVW